MPSMRQQRRVVLVRVQLGKFKCYACQWWGDEHDLLRFLEGIQDYRARLRRLDGLRAISNAATAANRAGPIFFRGPGSESPLDQQLKGASILEEIMTEMDERCAKEAFQELQPADKKALIDALAVMKKVSNGCPFDLVAGYCA